MKKFVVLLVLSCFAAGIVAPVAEAKRLSGGSKIAKHRSTPAIRKATREAPKATPAQPAQPAPTAQAAPAASPPSPAAAVPDPPVVPPTPGPNRWGGVLAGVGTGALIGSLFGGHLGGLGSAIGGLLGVLLIAGVLYLAWRLFAWRRRAARLMAPMQFIFAGGPPVNVGSSRAEPDFAQDAKQAAAEAQSGHAGRPEIGVPANDPWVVAGSQQRG